MVKRSILLVFVLSLLATLVPASVAGAYELQSRTTVKEELRMVELINRERRARGLPALKVQLQLVRLAREHSAAMAHDDERGMNCPSALRHRSPVTGGLASGWKMVRENVGCDSRGVDAMHTALMNSPGHRANILANDVEYVGVGVGRTGGVAWATQIFLRGGEAPNLSAIGEGIIASKATFTQDASAPFAIVSRGDVFADSLGGAALAGGLAPIYFTDAPSKAEPNPVLRPETRVELDRALGGAGKTVYLLGGTAAVSHRAESELEAAGYNVKRLAGSDRMSTAAAIAREVVRRYGQPSQVLAAYAYNWPDAVTAGSVAARRGAPVVLIDKGTVPSATSRFLGEVSGAKRVVIGGPAVISDAVVAKLRATRVAGADRAETALAVADVLGGGVGGDRIVVNEGWNTAAWGRTLAWSTYAAKYDAPQIFVNGQVPASVAAWLAANRGHSARFDTAVAAPVRAQVDSLLG